MIDRYTRAPMGQVWTLEQKFTRMLEVETAVAQAQSELKMIPVEAFQAIKKKGRFSVARILELEKTTKHDVIAFVSNVAENIGEAGRYVHFGLTSSDVLDTAHSLILRDAGAVLAKSTERLEKALENRIVQHAQDLCAGRTHGMHAEPTTFGLKLAGFWSELKRNQARVDRAITQGLVCKLSGAVGTFSAQDERVETRVAEILKLSPETFATQVVPRDRHAEIFWAIAMLGAGLERLAVELRHLQRTEVGEVVEGFTPGQKGSSAMPHKKNPIASENITGGARLLRGYLVAGLENIALWHERDISHSSVERVAFPDTFILVDYMADRMADTIEKLHVNTKRMRSNMDASQGQLFSSHLLLSLVESGLSREEAYAKVQKLSHSLAEGEQLLDKAKRDKEVSSRVSAKELSAIFSGARHLEGVLKLLERKGFIKTGSKAKKSKEKKK